MRAFNKAHGDVAELADAFFTNDPYYPRPVPSDALYRAFKEGYMNSCPVDYRTRAALFLQAIEARWSERNLVA